MAGTESSLAAIEQKAAELTTFSDPWLDPRVSRVLREIAEMIEGLAQEVQLLKEGRTI